MTAGYARTHPDIPPVPPVLTTGGRTFRGVRPSAPRFVECSTDGQPTAWPGGPLFRAGRGGGPGGRRRATRARWRRRGLLARGALWRPLGARGGAEEQRPARPILARARAHHERRPQHPRCAPPARGVCTCPVTTCERFPRAHGPTPTGGEIRRAFPRRSSAVWGRLTRARGRGDRLRNASINGCGALTYMCARGYMGADWASRVGLTSEI